MTSGLGLRSGSRRNLAVLAYLLIFAALLLGVTSFAATGAGTQTPAQTGQKQGEKPMKPAGVLVNPEPETELSIKVWLDKSSYQVGERLRIHFIISRDCYVYIYSISSQGKVTLLFPNAYYQANFLKAGHYTIPGKDARYSLVAEGQPGLEYIQALASIKPLTTLVVPSSVYKNNPFPLISTAPQELESQLTAQIRETLQPREWAADWISFYLVERGRARLVITSEPSGAQVYLNGHLVGRTPLEVSLEPGFVKIILKKEGYQSWAERIYIKQNEVEQIEAFLQAVSAAGQPPSSPPTGGETVPGEQPSESRPPTPSGEQTVELRPEELPTVAFNLGTDFNSLGLELGFGHILRFGLGMRFTGEAIPDYYEVEPPAQPWADELIYNDGPELELYLKLIASLAERFALVIGGGLAIQEQVHIAAPGASPGATAQDVTVKPNGYRKSASHLTALGGLLLRAEPFFFEIDYHMRRGWLLGVGIGF